MRVNIEISGIDLTQDLGPLIRSFYPHTDIEIFYMEKPGVTIDSSLGDHVIAMDLESGEFSISYDGELMSRTKFEYTDVPDERMSYEKRRHRAYRNSVLRELYKAISQRTGRTPPC